jgi:hypothetical protein
MFFDSLETEAHMRNKLFLTLGVAAMASMSQAVIVMNQIPTGPAQNDNAWNSQDYEAANDPKDINYIDDFTVGAGQTTLTMIEAAMTGFSGFTTPAHWANVTGYRVEVYTTAAMAGGNLTGNAGSQLVAAGSTSFVNLGFPIYSGLDRIVSIPINITLPGPGTYWVGVMGVLPAGQANMQIGVLNNISGVGGSNARLANPGAGWFPGGDIPSPGQDSAAYRLHAVPEPGSMIALGLGAAALLARRRRKAA